MNPTLATYERSVSVYDKDALRAGEDGLIRRFHGRVLDLGCGTGRTTAHLARTCTVTGIDYAPAMIARGRARHPNLDLRVMDARSLAFPDESFDGAFFSFNGLDYLYPLADRSLALKEIYRVLRPGGLFIYASHTGGRGRHTTLKGSLRGTYGRLWGRLHGVRYPYHASSTKDGILITYCAGIESQELLLAYAGFSLRETLPAKGESERFFIAEKPDENPQPVPQRRPSFQQRAIL